MCHPTRAKLLPTNDKQVQKFGAKMLTFLDDMWIFVHVPTNRQATC